MPLAAEPARLLDTCKPAARWPAVAFFACSLALLLGMLGTAPVSRTQEARVLVTGSEMLGGGLRAYLVPHCNGNVRLHKPPLAYWLAAGSFRVFGVHDWAARIPMALAAWLTLACTYIIGRRLLDGRSALLGSMMLLGSLLFFRYGRLAETDILVTLFDTLAIGAILAGWARHGRRGALLWHQASGIAIGLAILAKGLPAIYPVLFLLLLAWWTRRWGAALDWLRSGAILWAAAVGAPWFWYISRLPEWGRVGTEVDKVLGGGGHVGLPGAHVTYLVKACLPWTPLVILALISAAKQWKTSIRVRILSAWALAIFIPLNVAMQKQEHYLVPVMPPVMLLSAWALTRRTPRWLIDGGRLVLWGMAAVCAGAAVLAPAVGWRLRGAVSPMDGIMAAVALAASVAIAMGVRRRGFAGGLWHSVVAGSALLATLLGLWAPTWRADSFQKLATTLRTHYGGQSIASYGGEMLPLVFYMGRVVPSYDRPAELLHAWRTERMSVMLAFDKDLQRHPLPAELPLAERQRLRADGDLLVILAR